MSVHFIVASAQVADDLRGEEEDDEEEKQGEEACARQRLQFLNEIHRAYFLLKNHGLGCLRSGRGAIVDSTIAITITIGPCPPEMTPATQNVERCLRTMEGATENAL